jgi:AraC-like DNA-binding protein
MKLYIKFMVSLRCKLMVKDALNRIGIPYKSINLGEVELAENISEQHREQLQKVLLESGLELMDDKKAILIEKIKLIVIEMVHYSDEIPKVNFSEYLSEKLDLDYTYLSNLFSENQGLTIEHFVILHKIERAKELIIYDEKNLSEIANILHYSSVSHLSNQFKKITGLTPTFFKSILDIKRKSLDKILMDSPTNDIID